MAKNSVLGTTMKRRKFEKRLNPTGRRPMRAALKVLRGDVATRHGADAAAQISELESALNLAQEAVEDARTADARLREAIDILPQGIVFLDSQGRYVLWNEEYAKIYHRSADLFKVGTRLADTLRVGVMRGDYPAAKGREEDHSQAGARIARELGPRLGLTPSETETAVWLVEHHLVMSTFAQSRDLNDPKTIRDFAALVQSRERLKLLLVLTVADLRGVGPGVWTGWKGQLLRNLYFETEPLLGGGHITLSRSERVSRAQDALRER